MTFQKSLTIIAVFTALLIAGAWAMELPASSQTNQPADFDPGDPTDIPQTTVIDLEVKGLAQLGEVFMVEGISNETSAIPNGDTYTAGTTSYPRLVLHGIFEKQIRDWRDDVIKGSFSKRDIEIDLKNSKNQRVLRITFNNCFPTRFALPPLSLDGSTRYMERLEFVYDDFEITN